MAKNNDKNLIKEILSRKRKEKEKATKVKKERDKKEHKNQRGNSEENRW